MLSFGIKYSMRDVTSCVRRKTAIYHSFCYCKLWIPRHGNSRKNVISIFLLFQVFSYDFRHIHLTYPVYNMPMIYT